MAQRNLGADLLDRLLLDFEIADVVEGDAADRCERFQKIGLIDDRLLEQQAVDPLQRERGSALELAEFLDGQEPLVNEPLGDLGDKVIGVIAEMAVGVDHREGSGFGVYGSGN